jgi:hypothetical protein
MNEKDALRQATKLMQDASPLAAMTIIELMESKDEKMRLQAAQIAIERALGKASQAVEIKTEVTHRIDPYEMMRVKKMLEESLINGTYKDISDQAVLTHQHDDATH